MICPEESSLQMLFPGEEAARDDGLRTARPQLADEGADTIHKGIAGAGSGLRGGSGRGCRRRENGCDHFAFDAPLEDQCGTHPNAPDQHDHFGIVFRLNFGIGVVDQRRHEDLVDGLFLAAGFFGGRRLRCGLGL